jgi:hypothetical protein
LEELPPELGQLTYLRHLALRRERFELEVGDRIGRGLEKDRPTQPFTDLSPLGKSTALTTFSLWGCDSVSELGPLRSLTALTRLEVGVCKRVSDLEPLRTLTRLT